MPLEIILEQQSLCILWYGARLFPRACSLLPVWAPSVLSPLLSEMHSSQGTSLSAGTTDAFPSAPLHFILRVGALLHPAVCWVFMLSEHPS